MAAKFVKQDGEWLVEITCASTGTKAPEVGDIFSIKGRKVQITEIIGVLGTPETYGCQTLAKFKNF